MKIQSFLLAAFLLVCSSVRAQVPTAYAARLQYVLDSTCNLYQIKGASAAVYIPGSGMWKGVHGESHAGQPITPSMAFPINSNTKTYTSALLLKLQQDGQLSLSDTIGTWIQGRANISGQITIRQLLNHTSGLYSYTDSSAFGDSVFADYSRIWQPEDMLQFVGPPHFAPGTYWSYSNTNYLLAGMIIAQVTGMPVEQAFRTKLLNPNALTATWFYPQESPAAALVPHFWFYDGFSLDDATAFGYTPESFYSAATSAGALFSTAEDNANFWHKLISGQIINAASLSEWRQVIPLNPAVGYGLGMLRDENVNGRVIYQHGGSGAGALNENLADSASGVCISLLTNQDKVDNTILFEKVVAALHRVTLELPTAVAHLESAPGFSLYPNPASDEVRISFAQTVNAAYAYTITDGLGRVCKQGSLEKTGTPSIRIADLNGGLHYLQLVANGRVVGNRAFAIIK